MNTLTLGGNISVSMGDGNTVGQIGNIYNHPPPEPNAIMQNGKVFGILEGPVQETQSSVTANALHYTPGFDLTKPFWLPCAPGIELTIQNDGYSHGFVNFGGTQRSTIWNVLMKKGARLVS